jgi:primosomal protein N'
MANTFLVNLNTDFSRESKYLSTTLLDKIEKNLKNNQKIILYLNQR